MEKVVERTNHWFDSIFDMFSLAWRFAGQISIIILFEFTQDIDKMNTGLFVILAFLFYSFLFHLHCCFRLLCKYLPAKAIEPQQQLSIVLIIIIINDDHHSRIDSKIRYNSIINLRVRMIINKLRHWFLMMIWLQHYAYLTRYIYLFIFNGFFLGFQ